MGMDSKCVRAGKRDFRDSIGSARGSTWPAVGVNAHRRMVVWFYCSNRMVPQLLPDGGGAISLRSRNCGCISERVRGHRAMVSAAGACARAGVCMGGGALGSGIGAAVVGAIRTRLGMARCFLADGCNRRCLGGGVVDVVSFRT